MLAIGNWEKKINFSMICWLIGYKFKSHNPVDFITEPETHFHSSHSLLGSSNNSTETNAGLEFL